MTKPRVLVVGATGHTGSSIVDSLLEAGETKVEALVRPASSTNPSVSKLKERGVQVHIADITDEAQLTKILDGIDTVISTVGPGGQLDQLPLVKAAKTAGVKRFVPCAFITICPPGGVMWIRDQKEQVYQEIRKLKIPYTIIDVGYWYQSSFPTIPSGRVDYASLLVPNDRILGDADLKTAITDLRDIGPYVAKIIADERTLNKFVFAYGEVASQEEIFSKMEELSGEKIERKYLPSDKLFAFLEETRASFAYNFSDMKKAFTCVGLEYAYSKYVRDDNTPEYAKYLGYLDARDLYPDFVPRSLEAYLKELLAGKAAQTYEGMTIQIW